MQKKTRAEEGNLTYEIALSDAGLGCPVLATKD